MTRRAAWRLAVAAVVAAGVAVAGGPPAGAHPLGNFSVNHLNALRLEPDRIVNEAVVDIAEIPTAQAAGAIDADGDGTASPDELDRFGRQRCAALRDAQTLTVDGDPVPFAVDASSYGHQPGQAGLPVGRLECRLVAPVDLGAARTVAFADSFESGRVGWHEIVAVGDGVELLDASVATASVTGGLRSYPVELLQSPPDVREASFAAVPGVAGRASPDADAGAARDRLVEAQRTAPLGTIERVNRTFDDLIGRRELSVGVGLLAVTLALVLGASHALLPGHGKTVMAAYIAGRQGSVRDAVIVGATVTGTHTGGVLALGLALTLSTSLAGEQVLGWLGVASGVLVAALGAGLLVGLRRHRRGDPGAWTHGHRHGYRFGSATHGPHDHDHHDGHHDHDHDGHHDHDHDGRHDHGHDGHHDHHREHDLAVVGHRGGSTTLTAPAPTSPADHTHDELGTPPHGQPFSRRGLVVMGVAGGLVPSPSALIIFLSAIALGRTAFGVLLVFGYGLGMAATLTAAGIALVRARDWYQRRARSTVSRARSAAWRWTVIAPYATAALVLVVGLGLTVRGLALV